MATPIESYCRPNLRPEGVVAYVSVVQKFWYRIRSQRFKSSSLFAVAYRFHNQHNNIAQPAQQYLIFTVDVVEMVDSMRRCIKEQHRRTIDALEYMIKDSVDSLTTVD
nr:hypothetical protein CFP56_31634 [Quercus suber]